MNIVRCPECNHPAHDHNNEQVPKSANCSFGWCKCPLLRPQVLALGTPVTISTKPAFDHASGRWSA